MNKLRKGQLENREGGWREGCSGCGRLSEGGRRAAVLDSGGGHVVRGGHGGGVWLGGHGGMV